MISASRLCAVALAALVVCGCSAHPTQASKEIAWCKTYSLATSSAKERNVLVMVDFYTDWCGWCKRLDKDTYPDARVVDQSKLVASVKVDAEKEGKDLATKYGVKGYPTILFLDPAGEVWGRIGSYEAPEQFSADMAKIIAGHRDYPSLTERVTKTAQDVEAAARLTAIEAGRGNEKAALEMLAKAEAADPDHASKFLAPAYSAVGDYYQNGEKYADARKHFEKAVTSANTGFDKAYARISIAACLMSENRPKDAVPYLKAVLEQKDAPKDLLSDAEQMMNAAKSGG